MWQARLTEELGLQVNAGTAMMELFNEIPALHFKTLARENIGDQNDKQN